MRDFVRSTELSGTAATAASSAVVQFMPGSIDLLIADVITTAFVGTVQVKYRDSGCDTEYTLPTTYTAATSVSINSGVPREFRLYMPAFTSGTLVATLAQQDTQER